MSGFETGFKFNRNFYYYYFSVTGNCKWVAEQIADATGEKTYSNRESLDQKSRILTVHEALNG